MKDSKIQSSMTGHIPVVVNTSKVVTTVNHFTVWMNKGFEGVYNTINPEYSIQLTKPLLLADGTSLSIQAGRHNYSTPRKNSVSGDYIEYTHFEIGYPSKVIPEILEYATDKNNPTDTVYANVPREVIRDFIKARGGVIGHKELIDETK